MKKKKKPGIQLWGFPLCVLCLYLAGMFFSPENTYRAIRESGSIFQRIAIPISIAVMIMIIFNRFLSPATIVNLLGKNAGIKGIFLSSAAGILSMGPVYSWYPLLKSLAEKGASNFHIANFIGCRSIKPFLLPVFISYFSLQFAIAFVVICLIASFIVAWIVSVACSRKGAL